MVYILATILLLVQLTDTFKIERNATGDKIFDFGPGEAIKYCNQLVDSCKCDSGTVFDEAPDLCKKTLEETNLKIYSDGKLHDLYTVPFNTENQNYTVVVKRGDDQNISVANMQPPIFVRDVLTKMEWNAVWVPDLMKRTRIVRKEGNIEITFNRYWSGFFLKICLADQSCVAVKFEGKLTYPLSRSEVFSVIGDELPSTTTTTTTSTTTSTTTTSTTTTTTERTTTKITDTTTTITTLSTTISTTSTTTKAVTTTQTTTTVAPNTAALGDDSDEEIFIIIGVIFAFFIIIFIILVICCYIGRRRKNGKMGKDSGVAGQHDYVRHLNSEEGLSSSPRTLNTRIQKTFYDKINISSIPRVPKASKPKNKNKEMGIVNDNYVEVEEIDDSPKERQNPVFEGPSDTSLQPHYIPHYSKKIIDDPEYATVVRKGDKQNNSPRDEERERVDIV